MQRTLVLASTSPFRRELLGRLGLKFETASPDVDESREPEESASDLVERLSLAKARAVAELYPDALIIGSDQVATHGGEVIGKPGTHERAAAQLRAASGQTLTFLTGLCLYDARTQEAQIDLVPFRVHFRPLREAQIENYLRREQPYNCAGSFKSEGLGISLFRALDGDDPNALIGLPLIRLIDMLEQVGVDVLAGDLEG